VSFKNLSTSGSFMDYLQLHFATIPSSTWVCELAWQQSVPPFPACCSLLSNPTP
jgi:hypothetical protein